MQFSNVFLAAAAFALINAAPQFTMPPSFFATALSASSIYNLTWSGASGPVTLLLKNGDPSNLQTVSTIASGLTSTSFAFSPSPSLPNGEYAFEIDDSTGPNYSEQFSLTGGAASASLTASTTSGSTTSGSTLTTTTALSTATRTSNSTTTSLTKTATKASTTLSGTSTSTSTTSPKINAASSFASPLAFVFLALAAMVTLN